VVERIKTLNLQRDYWMKKEEKKKRGNQKSEGGYTWGFAATQIQKRLRAQEKRWWLRLDGWWQ